MKRWSVEFWRRLPSLRNLSLRFVGLLLGTLGFLAVRVLGDALSIAQIGVIDVSRGGEVRELSSAEAVGSTVGTIQNAVPIGFLVSCILLVPLLLITRSCAWMPTFLRLAYLIPIGTLIGGALSVGFAFVTTNGWRPVHPLAFAASGILLGIVLALASRPSSVVEVRTKPQGERPDHSG